MIAKKKNQSDRAAVFGFRLRDAGLRPRLLEWMVALRGKIFALPYGDQGLLIAKSFYHQLGGYRDIAIMEDVDLIRKIGRKNLYWLEGKITTSAIRYQRQGYLRRAGKNLCCLGMYYCKISPEKIAAFYSR